MVLSITFATVVIYLRFCQGSTARRNTGFQRYELLGQDEDDIGRTERSNGRKSSRSNRPMEIDSDDEDDDTLFVSKMKKVIAP